MESAAKEFLKENAKDPSSIDIANSKILGKTSNGLSYLVRYRGKNSFGAMVINTQKLLLKWDINNKIYYVAGQL